MPRKPSRPPLMHEVDDSHNDFPLVDKELHALAREAIYLLGTGIRTPDQYRPYQIVDRLAEADVIPRYPVLIRFLIEKSHHTGSGWAARVANPAHHRLSRALFTCQSLEESWLNILDKRIIDLSTRFHWIPICNSCRIKIAAHPNASPSLWKAMLSRHAPSEELIERINKGRAALET